MRFVKTITCELFYQVEDFHGEFAIYSIIFSALFEGVPAFEQPANSALIKTVHELTGHNPQSVAFATEAPFLQAHGMQTVVMGPGSIDQAHQANEFIALSELKPAVEVLEAVIKRFCVSG